MKSAFGILLFVSDSLSRVIRPRRELIYVDRDAVASCGADGHDVPLMAPATPEAVLQAVTAIQQRSQG